MPKQPDFDAYLSFLCEPLGRGRGHTHRDAAFQDYCRGLMLPLERKSVEPLAASVAPFEVSARHQALHHFVSRSDWDDQTVLERVAEWVVPAMAKSDPELFWIIDDTGIPKKGRHSVGVARQYCGILGKQDNCQIAVSLSVANATTSLPVQWRLYLPKAWAEDPERRRTAGVPDTVAFATKTEIALSQLQRAHASELPRGTVVADAGYGNDAALRAGITELGLTYMMAVKRSTKVWTRSGQTPSGRRSSPDERGSAGKESACTGLPYPDLASGNEHTAVVPIRGGPRPRCSSQGQTRTPGSRRVAADRVAEG